MPSFDVVSELNMQEVDNAVNQASKEIIGRFDFKGSASKIEWDKKELSLVADNDYRITSMRDILQTKLHKRGIDLRAIKFEDPEAIGGQLMRQKISLKQGIDKEISKKIIQAIKDKKLKVQPQLQDDKIKVTGKSIDELQGTIQFLKSQTFDVPLQFENMRS